MLFSFISPVTTKKGAVWLATLLQLPVRFNALIAICHESIAMRQTPIKLLTKQ
jgi:hypothetical protein